MKGGVYRMLTNYARLTDNEKGAWPAPEHGQL